MGGVDSDLVPELCNGCGLCMELGKDRAITTGDDSLPRKDANKCLHYGDCILVFTTQAWEVGRAGYTVYVGGKVDRHPQLATMFAAFVSHVEGIELVAAILEFTITRGKKGERLGASLNRIGDATLRDNMVIPI